MRSGVGCTTYPSWRQWWQPRRRRGPTSCPRDCQTQSPTAPATSDCCPPAPMLRPAIMYVRVRRGKAHGLLARQGGGGRGSPDVITSTRAIRPEPSHKRQCLLRLPSSPRLWVARGQEWTQAGRAYSTTTTPMAPPQHHTHGHSRLGLCELLLQVLDLLFQVLDLHLTAAHGATTPHTDMSVVIHRPQPRS